MAGRLDVMREMQRQVEARRSGSARVPVASAEEEVAPTGSEYSEYSPLDKTGLRDGYKMSVGNARRLSSDARALMDAGRHRSAHLILLLALEELGSAVQLYEAGRSGVQDWEAWWRRYFSHPKDLESTSLGIARREKANERFVQVREDLVYVNFDKKQQKFIAPPEEEDSELLELVGKEAAYAEAVLKVLPPHAFERSEFELMVRQSPEITPAVLYACIEELVSQEPTVSERDLLTAIALDLGRSPDDFAAGFKRWKEVGPKARVYVDILRGVQDRMKEQGKA
jgi:hypothetical protein